MKITDLATSSGSEFAWCRQEDEESIAAIHRALELGAGWIDTAMPEGLAQTTHRTAGR
jgi:aryl-alcohol dehydrogenase-like predicted oxidoreductase